MRSAALPLNHPVVTGQDGALPSNSPLVQPIWTRPIHAITRLLDKLRGGAASPEEIDNLDRRLFCLGLAASAGGIVVRPTLVDLAPASPAFDLTGWDPSKWHVDLRPRNFGNTLVSLGALPWTDGGRSTIWNALREGGVLCKGQ